MIILQFLFLVGKPHFRANFQVKYFLEEQIESVHQPRFDQCGIVMKKLHSIMVLSQYSVLRSHKT